MWMHQPCQLAPEDYPDFGSAAAQFLRLARAGALAACLRLHIKRADVGQAGVVEGFLGRLARIIVWWNPGPKIL